MEAAVLINNQLRYIVQNSDPNSHFMTFFDLSNLKKGLTNVFKNYTKLQHLLQQLRSRVICLWSPLLNLAASAKVGE